MVLEGPLRGMGLQRGMGAPKPRMKIELWILF